MKKKTIMLSLIEHATPKDLAVWCNHGHDYAKPEWPSFASCPAGKFFRCPFGDIHCSDVTPEMWAGLVEAEKPKKSARAEGDYDAETLALPLQWRAMLWISQGETGISSRAIWDCLAGPDCESPFKPQRWDGSPPQDPSDFRRCWLLLQLIPEWRPRLGEVAQKYPAWKALVEHWDELERLYAEERPTGNAPKLYDRMKELLK